MLSTDGEVEKRETSGTVVGKVDWDTQRSQPVLSEIMCPQLAGPSNPTANVMTQGDSYRAPSGDTYSTLAAGDLVLGEWVCKLE